MHVLGMPPAFVLSQDQTLKLASPRRYSRASPGTARSHLAFGTDRSIQTYPLLPYLDAHQTAPRSAAACASLPTYSQIQRAGSRGALPKGAPLIGPDSHEVNIDSPPSLRISRALRQCCNTRRRARRSVAIGARRCTRAKNRRHMHSKYPPSTGPCPSFITRNAPPEHTAQG